MRWEVGKIHAALSAAGIPCMLLKGAAYEAVGASPAGGRLFGDVDVMVPHEQLLATETALVKNGWMTTKLDAYDQRYYRKWMHEIPPMLHLKRRTAIDVHHTILPPTAALKPDPAKLWERAVGVPGKPALYVLSPEDMVLHSATHLFHDGEFENGLRDLVDLDALLNQNAGAEGFWPRLVARASERPREVLPTPGGPTRHRIGPLSFFTRCCTARYSRIRSLTFSRP